MKKIIVICLIFIGSYSIVNSQVIPTCEGVTAFDKSKTPDLGIVIYSGEAETVWNALRLATFSQTKGDTVVIFVLGKALDVYMNDTSKFKVQELCDKFLNNGGEIFACASCAKIRHTDDVKSCTITSIGDMYEIIMRSRKTITF